MALLLSSILVNFTMCMYFNILQVSNVNSMRTLQTISLMSLHSVKSCLLVKFKVCKIIMVNHHSCHMHTYASFYLKPKVKLPYYSTNIKLYSLCPDNQDFNHAVDLVTYYRQSEEYQHVQKQLQPLLDDLIEREMTEGSTAKPKTVAYATNIFWQVLTFAVRLHFTCILLCTCKSLQNKIDISCISK